MGRPNIRYTFRKNGEYGHHAEEFVCRLEDYIESFRPVEELPPDPERLRDH